GLREWSFVQTSRRGESSNEEEKPEDRQAREDKIKEDINALVEADPEKQNVWIDIRRRPLLPEDTDPLVLEAYKDAEAFHYGFGL
ncbi:unnamed protein product, partial [Amoebophrya sp. A25]